MNTLSCIVYQVFKTLDVEVLDREVHRLYATIHLPASLCLQGVTDLEQQGVFLISIISNTNTVGHIVCIYPELPTLKNQN